MRYVTKHADHGGYVCPNLGESRDCNVFACAVDCIVRGFGEFGECSRSCGTGVHTKHRTVAQQPEHGGKSCPALAATAQCNTHSCPRDCSVSSFGDWSACSKSCGTSGITRRSRHIMVQVETGGAGCPSLEQTKSCNTHVCPVDCVVGAFSEWSSCTKTCGTGFHTRKRTASTATAAGGAACPLLTDVRQCATGPCPFHCVVSAWSSWAACSQSCGTGGTQSRTRVVVSHAEHGGYVCPSLKSAQACNTVACPVDCVVSLFGAWDACTHTCGAGLQHHTRRVIVDAEHGGQACPTLTGNQVCNAQPCAVDCQTSSFGAWGICSKSCGGGWHKRTRTITVSPLHGGKTCPDLLEDKQCNTHACPVDCVQSAFSEWGACTKTCGTGTSERSRSVTTHPAHGGVACLAASEHMPCNSNHCPVHCAVSSFGDWSACTRSCGGGSQKCTRSVDTASDHGGTDCPALLESRACNSAACPIDCALSLWSKWSDCTLTCAGGTQSRSRTILQAAEFGGMPCPGWLQSQACNTQGCPVDCQVSTFGLWNQCSHFCGSGTKTRTRSVIVQPINGGKSCNALAEDQACNTMPCAVDCAVSQWSEWGACSATCNEGVAHRTRRVTRFDNHGGSACPNLDESRTCQRGPCPIHCEVSAWSLWNGCTKSCGGGRHKRVREVLTSPLHGGDECPLLTQARGCNSQQCAQDCVTTPFDDWSACSASCGTGSQSRSRRIDSPPERGGKACPLLSAYRACNTHTCPIDCLPSAWGSWTTCDRTCAGGTQTRARSIVQSAAFGGSTCNNPLTSARVCNTNPCPIHCVVTAWSDWSVCTTSCGAGLTNRVRSVTTHSEHGGYLCPTLREEHACNTHPCPVDCTVSPFGAWSTCTKSCGSGTQEQARTVTLQQGWGGVSCPALKRSRSCSVAACPVDCALSQWTEWSACGTTCGDSTQHRSRSVSTATAHGGKVCGVLSATRACNSGPCPVHCIVSSWAPWTACHRSCGGGAQSRSRSIVRHFTHGGFQCPNLSEVRACNSHVCPIDCTLSEFGPWSTCTRTCGSGQSRRVRALVTAAQHGGSCNVLEEYTPCNTAPCPVDCKVSEWSMWTVCSRSCSAKGGGEGLQERMRTVTQPASHGGVACPSLKLAKPCGTVPCGCSHVTCEYKVHEIHLKKSIRVIHDVREMFGSRHKCAWAQGKCSCTCSDYFHGESSFTSNTIISKGMSPEQLPFDRLDHCHGDCDNDAHCKAGHKCHQQNHKEAIPGCAGIAQEGMDYCIRTTRAPTANAAPSMSPYFRFMLEFNSEVKAAHPTWSGMLVNAELNRRWKALPWSGKEPYITAYRADQARKHAGGAF